MKRLIQVTSLLLVCIAPAATIPAQQPSPSAAPAPTPTPRPEMLDLRFLRYKISAGDLASAESILEVHRADKGEDGEYLLGLAWLARGAVLVEDWPAAARYAKAARSMAMARLGTPAVWEHNSEAQYALGTAIEVDAQEYEASDPGADEELRSEYLSEGELDVAAWARDQVALAVPDQILCRPDCAGLCPVCGKDLNLEPHEHEEQGVDPRWAALEALRGEPGES